MTQRIRDRLRRGMFGRPYVPPIDESFPVEEQDLPETGETPLDIEALATVPAGNTVTITIPADCPIQLKYTPEA